jgi:hypothetical protein
MLATKAIDHKPEKVLSLTFKTTDANTHNDIQLLQAREALEKVKDRIQIRANRVKKQNLHCVHFSGQADGNHFLEKKKTRAI